MSPTDPPEPPFSQPEPVEPAFDPAAASAPGATGPLPSPDDPAAPYGAFGDSTGTTTILHEGDHVHVERETYPHVDVEVVEDPLPPVVVPPDTEFDPFKGIDGPIEDIPLEDLLDRPIAPPSGSGDPSSSPSATDDPDHDDDDDEERPGRSGSGWFRP